MIETRKAHNSLKTCRTNLILASLVVLLLTAQVSLRAEDDSKVAIPLSIRMKNGWTIVESPNFRCQSQSPAADTKRMAECCEAWRGRLRKIWITDPESANWVPKCDVIVHRDKAAYNHALNRPGDYSVGTTTMTFDDGRAVLRRIDVRADASDWSNAALPHELTHVVLGDRFGGHALPRWADEGIAMLSECPEKLRERLTNLREILARRQSLRLTELVNAKQLPAPHLRDAFYGQSVALTSLLVRKSSPAQFADFIEQSQRQGLNQALNEQYKVNGLVALQQNWDHWVSTPQTIELVGLQLHSGLTPIVGSAINR